MPKIPLFGAGLKGKSVDVESQERVNLYPEMGGPDAKNITAIYGTPGLTLFKDLSANPIRGVYSSPKGRFFAVTGDEFVELDADGVETARGTLGSTSGMVTFAENTHEIILADLNALEGWIFDTDTNVFTQITDANYPAGGHVVHINGRFVLNVPETGEFYWSDAEDGFTWDALNFATAEGSPDDLLAMAVCRNELYLIGGSTIETWYDTGVSATLYRKVPGTLKNKGTAAARSVVSSNDKVFWLGSGTEGHAVVWMSSGYEIMRISNNAIEYKIREYSSISDAIGFTYKIEGHVFYVLTFPTGGETWVYDISTGIWHQWGHLNTITGVNGIHIANCQAFFEGENYVGSSEDGKIYKLDPDVYTDNGQEIHRELVTPHIHNDRKRYFYNSFEIDMESGVGLAGVPPACPTSWEVVAPEFDGTHTATGGMAEYDSELYAAAGSDLYKWNGTDAWSRIINTSGVDKYGLVKHDNSLWAPAYWYGHISAWTGPPSSSWSYSFEPGAASSNYSVEVLVLGTTVYVVSGNTAKLYRWAGWFPTTMVAVSDAGPTGRLRCGLVFNGEIYAAGEYGTLLKWNGTDAWVTLVSGSYDVNDRIFKMIEYNGEIYGITDSSAPGTTPSGRVVKYDGASSWEYVTDKITGLDNLYTIAIVDNLLVTGGEYVTGSNQHRCLYRVDADTSTLTPIVYDAAAGGVNSDLTTFTYFDGYYYATAGGTLIKWACEQGGLAGTITTPGYDPQAMLQISNDGGHTWGSELWADIGKMGEYESRVKWRRLGYSRDRVFKLTISDPVKVVLIAGHIEAGVEV